MANVSRPLSMMRRCLQVQPEMQHATPPDPDAGSGDGRVADALDDPLLRPP